MSNSIICDCEHCVGVLPLADGRPDDDSLLSRMYPRVIAYTSGMKDMQQTVVDLNLHLERSRNMLGILEQLQYNLDAPSC